ncbi:MAG: AraC family transcriptional regulator [Eubacteriales bacterium]
MASSNSNRILVTPSVQAKTNYLYVQEVGTLESVQPHISKRHNLTSYLFLIIIKGSGTLTYKEETYHLTAGVCAFIDCNYHYSHESSPIDQWQLKWVHFDGITASSFYDFFTNSTSSPIFHVQQPNQYIQCIDTIFLQHTEFTLYSELYCHLELTKLITFCTTDQQANNCDDSSINEKLSAIYHELRNNYHKPISLEQLSQQFFISKYYLARIFKKKYGSSIITTLVTIRISHAKELLRFTNISISNISQQCGFQDTSYFIKAFKQKEGITPLSYRKKW